MACGNNHTLAVTEDGQLYACGSNDFGQLGHDGCRTKLRMYIYEMCTLIICTLKNKPSMCILNL